MSASEAHAFGASSGRHRRLTIALGFAIALHLALALVWTSTPKPEPNRVISLSLVAAAPLSNTEPSEAAGEQSPAVSKAPNAPAERTTRAAPEPPTATTPPREQSFAQEPSARKPIDLDRAREELLRGILDAPTAEPEPRNTRRLYTSGTNTVRDQYYLDAWTRELERVGRLNYPHRARQEGITGSLRLLVAIGGDGRLAGVRIVSPSGHAVLDEAALRIIRLAAPYAPPPKEMMGDADVLEIVHTWQFARRRPG